MNENKKNLWKREHSSFLFVSKFLWHSRILVSQPPAGDNCPPNKCLPLPP